MFNVVRVRKSYKERRPDPREQDFIKLYRFAPENVDWLSEQFLTEVDDFRGGALDARTKMKIFLRYMGDPGFQIGVGENIGVSQPTVSNTIRFVSQAIASKADQWIQFPTNVDLIDSAKGEWLQKYNFPTAIGALDCTQSKIKKVPNNLHGDEYIYMQERL